MRILVSGANGFIGAAVCRRALAAGHEVHGLVRVNSDLSQLEAAVTRHVADLNDPATLHEVALAAQPEALIHCAAVVPVGRPNPVLSHQINVEGTGHLVRACLDAGCRRVVHISSMSANPDNKAVYGSTKRESEEALKALDVEWTILRPSLVYGAADRSVFAKMVGLLRKVPVVPVIGSGKEPVRPVHVDDVAAACLAVLRAQVAVGQTYMLGGADELDVNGMLRAVMRALGKQPRLIHLPLWMARLLATMLSPVMANPPFTHDNIEGVETAKFCDIEPAARDFGYAPRAFEDGLRESLPQQGPR